MKDIEDLAEQRPFAPIINVMDREPRDHRIEGPQRQHRVVEVMTHDRRPRVRLERRSCEPKHRLRSVDRDDPLEFRVGVRHEAAEPSVAAPEIEQRTNLCRKGLKEFPLTGLALRQSPDSFDVLVDLVPFAPRVHHLESFADPAVRTRKRPWPRPTGVQGRAARHRFRGVGTFVGIGDYPGRGVLVRRRSDGGFEWAYFVTGRSESSRSRQARTVGDAVFIEPTGPAQADPLRHYACARPFPNGLIIGNGDHVDVVADQLNTGVGLDAALAGIVPEPDPPINTPRIGAVIQASSAIVFSVADNQGAIERRTTEMPPAPHTIAVQTTYDGSVDEPVGSAPLRLLTSDEPFERIVDDLWSTLRVDLRVLLLAGVGSSVSDSRLAHPAS